VGQRFILTYHSLDTSGSVISLAPDSFRKQMEWLAESGAPVVPLERIRETSGGVALTFDDGFRNFYRHAFPVLAAHRFPATVFIVSGYCGGRNDWPTQPRNTGVPVLELMRWSEVAEVARAGIGIGCHTATHPPLTALAKSEMESELADSRAAIEDRIGRQVESFAYPYGDAAPGVRAAVGRHFRLACSTRLGPVSAASDPLDLPRVDIYYFRTQFWFRALGMPHGAGYLAARAMLRGVRRKFQ
jgi:peptidoglycan/xylan/chitin deacetylase (PgdA/CDA1 family)